VRVGLQEHCHVARLQALGAQLLPGPAGIGRDRLTHFLPGRHGVAEGARNGDALAGGGKGERDAGHAAQLRLHPGAHHGEQVTHHASIHRHEVGNRDDADPLQLVDRTPADAPDLGHRQPGVVALAHLRVGQVAQSLQVGLGLGKSISRLCNRLRGSPSNTSWYLCNAQDIGT